MLENMNLRYTTCNSLNYICRLYNLAKTCLQISNIQHIREETTENNVRVCGPIHDLLRLRDEDQNDPDLQTLIEYLCVM